jgi:hypothetical protein
VQELNNESGLVLIEAVIVFPVMFLAIFLLIFMGNAYYEKCKVEAAVAEVAADGAAYCADAMLRYVDEEGAVPPFEDAPGYSAPYRYFADMGGVENAIEAELGKKLGNIGTGLFSGMKPQPLKTTVSLDNGVIHMTLSVDLEYRLTLPVKPLGAAEYFSLKVRTRAEKAVTDAAEFMRNVNMAEDYIEQTGAEDKIDGEAKIADAINKAKETFG